jgi:hypothetical protein
MKKSEHLRAAFPQTVEINGVMYNNAGLSKRELFAAMIAQGIASEAYDIQYRQWGAAPNTLAKQAVALADALIEELNAVKP